MHKRATQLSTFDILQLWQRKEDPIKNLPPTYGDYCYCVIFFFKAWSLTSASSFFSIFPKPKTPNTHNLENLQTSK